MAKYSPDELKSMLNKYFTKVDEQQHIDQGYDAVVGQPVWYDLNGEPKYAAIGEKLGIGADKVKMSFDSWCSAGNTPPGQAAAARRPTITVEPLQMGVPKNSMASPSAGLSGAVQTLNSVAQLKQAEMAIAAADNAMGTNQQPASETGAIIQALTSALANKKDDTSSMAMFMQMNQQSTESARLARDSGDQRFTALLNIMLQQQAQNQQMILESMRGGGSKSALEEKLLDHTVQNMLTGNQSPEDTMFTSLVNSGQLPEIGKGLLDGVANVLAARKPPTTQQPSYLAGPASQPMEQGGAMQQQPMQQQVVQQQPMQQQVVQPDELRLSFDEKCGVVMEGFHNNLPDTYKGDPVYIGVLKKQVEVAIQRAEDQFPNDVRQQLICADKEMHLVVNLRSIAVNINRIVVGEVSVKMATQVLKGLPIFDQHFRGESYESLMQKIVPYQAADPPGQKMFAWDIEFLMKDEAANAIRQILVAANN